MAVPSLTEVATSSSTSSLATEFATILSRPWRLLALLVQAPLAAFLIVVLVGTNFPAPILFWLGLAQRSGLVWRMPFSETCSTRPDFAPGCPRRVSRRSLFGC